MKIVELGHSGVGKTTYMASMYAALQKKIEGISLETIDMSEHERLCKLAENIKISSYPPRTSYRSDYSFNLQYEGKNILPFFWADYRGKALSEKKKYSDEFIALQNDLTQADGIIIFLDCNTLSLGDVRINEVRRITVLLTSTLAKLNHPISVAIVFTKIDLVKKFDVKMLESIRQLIDAISKSKLISGALIPIACGKENINIEMPLLYALKGAIRTKIDLLQKDIDFYNKQINEYKKNARKHDSITRNYRNKSSGIGGSVRDWWRKNIQEISTYAELASQEAELAKEKWDEVKQEKQKKEKILEEYRPIQRAIDSLDSHLQKLPHIEEGKKIDKYIREMSRFKPGFFRRLINWFLNLFR